MASIHIGVPLDLTEFKAGFTKLLANLKSIGQNANNTMRSFSRAFDSKPIEQTSASIMKQQALIEQLKAKLKAISDIQTKTAAFEQITEDLKSAETESKYLEESLVKVSETLKDLQLVGAADIQIEEQSNKVEDFRRRVDESQYTVNTLRQELAALNMPEQPKKTAEQLASELEIAEQKLSEMQAKSKQLGKTAPKAMRDTGKAAKKASGDFGGLGSAISKTLTRIKQLLVSVLVFNVLRSVFKSLRDYIGAALKDNQAFANSFAQVKANIATAFQPILQIIIPILTKLMQWLAMATQYLVQFISALTGKSVKAMQDAAKYMDKLAENTKKASKEADKALAPFDEIQQLAETTADIAEDGIVPQYEDIPDIKFPWLDDLIDKLQPAIDSLKNLWDIMQPFREFVWQGILDFYNLVLKPIGTWVMAEAFPRFVDAISNMLAKVDWNNLNSALERLWKAVTPFAINIGEGLLWFWENVITPLIGWALDNLIPAALDLISAALRVLNVIIDAAKPTLLWLWDKILKPFGEWTGKIIIDAIKWLTEKLTEFSDWAKNNQTAMELISATILGFLAGLLLYSGMTTIITWFKTISAALVTFGTSGVIAALGAALPAVAIGTLAAAIVYVGSVWDKMSGAQQAITILGALAAAAIAAAIAIAVFHASWSIGIAAAAIVGGIVAIGIAFASVQKNMKDIGTVSVPSNIFGMSTSLDPSKINLSKFSSNPLPKLATGNVFMPNKETAFIAGDHHTQREILAPEDVIRQIVREETGGNNRGQQVIEATLMLNEREFGNIVLTTGNQERTRKGTNFVVTEVIPV